MPGQDGFATAENIFNINRQQKIYACSGHWDQSDQQKADNLGIKGHIDKPVSASNIK